MHVTLHRCPKILGHLWHTINCPFHRCPKILGHLWHMIKCHFSQMSQVNTGSTSTANLKSYGFLSGCYCLISLYIEVEAVVNTDIKSPHTYSSISGEELRKENYDDTIWTLIIVWCTASFEKGSTTEASWHMGEYEREKYWMRGMISLRLHITNNYNEAA